MLSGARYLFTAVDVSGELSTSLWIYLGIAHGNLDYMAGRLFSVVLRGMFICKEMCAFTLLSGSYTGKDRVFDAFWICPGKELKECL